jgi:alpha-beta hydrolase superfamily lysophospholipase
METAEYAPGRGVDVYGAPAEATVLLWHGMQTDARRAVGPLAARVAARGLPVIAPDWDSHAPDGGRSDLVASAEFARSWAPSAPLAVVGWSLGAAAAAGLAVAGDGVCHAVCLAGAFGTREVPPAPPRAVPFTLVHGTADNVVSPEASREFAAQLRRLGWPVDLIELPTDHGAIVGARYDAEADRYEPSDDPDALHTADTVAGIIAAAVSGAAAPR